MVDRSINVYKYYLEGYGYQVTFIVNLTDITVILLLFYTHYKFLIPRYLKQTKYIKYSILVALLLTITFLLQYLHAIYISEHLVDCEPYLKSFESNAIYYVFQDIFYLLVSAGARFSSDWFRDRELREALASQKVESELAMLKYQISPHFLHNTLHNINYLVKVNPEQASEYVVKLSELMRYMLYTVKLESVQLTEEITYIRHFVELQKIRLSRSNIVEFRTEGKISNQSIRPMLLISFVENSFKHGDVLSSTAQIIILVKMKENILYFEVTNGIQSRSKESTTGIGIENVRRRLELLYPTHHELDIKKTETEFRVTLTIDLSWQ